MGWENRDHPSKGREAARQRIRKKREKGENRYHRLYHKEDQKVERSDEVCTHAIFFRREREVCKSPNDCRGGNTHKNTLG